MRRLLIFLLAGFLGLSQMSAQGTGQIVPQLAVGGPFECVLFISNKGDVSFNGEVYFRQGNAAPWTSELTVNGNPLHDSEFPFSLTARQSLKLVIKGDEEVRIGYLNIYGDVSWARLAVGFFYNLLDDDRELLDSIGSPPAHGPVASIVRGFEPNLPTEGKVSFAVERSPTVRTGLAITHGLRLPDAVISGQTFRGTLYDQDGNAVRTVDFNNDGHRAQFIDEIWDDLPVNFVGMMQLEPLDSNGEEQVVFHVTVLRLEFNSSGFQFTAIPADIVSETWTVIADPLFDPLVVEIW